MSMSSKFWQRLHDNGELESFINSYEYIHSANELSKSSSIEQAASVITYLILGMPLFSLMFIGFFVFAYITNIVIGMFSTRFIYHRIAYKRYKIIKEEQPSDSFFPTPHAEEKADAWLGKYIFLVYLLHIIIGMLSALLFKVIWG